MLGFIIKKIFGSRNDREVRRLRPLVANINALEAELQKLPDDALRQKTAAWKEELSKIQDAEELARRVTEILPEAFAVVKNACRRLCGTEIIVRDHPLKWEMIPFDVQLIGGYALHTGRIAEMATGEGKTLVATLPVYLNALTGRGVHVVTVNDYLAARDSEWMGAVYRFLGLTVGCILHDQDSEVRRQQYKPTVEGLVHTQERLCNRFLSEVEGLIKKLRPADGSNPQTPDALEKEIGLLLYRVKIGNPRSEALMRLLEDPDNVRLMNKAE